MLSYTPRLDQLHAVYERVTTAPTMMRSWRQPYEDAYRWLSTCEYVLIDPDGYVLFPSEQPGFVYRVGSVQDGCNCMTHRKRSFCWHRAAKRLLDMHWEMDRQQQIAA